MLSFCIVIYTNAQSDSLTSYVNMSFEELLNVKLTTAGKNEQQVKDIPASVVVITRADIEAFGYHSLSEILKNVAGMYMTNDYSMGGTNFGIRGYWTVLPNNNMMIFVNDVDQISIPYSSYQLEQITVPVEAIERIEIIRGPMSVLYGSGAFFGVINIFTKNVNPGKSVTNLISTSAGTQKTAKAMIRLSNNINEFSYSLNASAFTSSGIDQPYNKMNDNTSIFKTSSTKGYLKQKELYFGFNAKMKSFYTDISYNESNSGLMFLFPSAGNGSYGNSSSTIITLGNKSTIKDKLTIDCKLTYYNSIRKSYYDVFYKDAYEYQDVPSKAWDADLTVNSDLTSKLHLIAGAKYRSILSVENNLHLPTHGFGFYYNTTQTLDDNSHIDSWASFAQLDFEPVENLKIVVGGRLEQRFSFTLKTIIADTLFGVPAEIIREIYDQHKVQFIPRVAFVYSISDKNIIKFLYGNAINSPSWFQVMNGGEHHLDLRSQYIQSYELNYITTPFSKLLVNTSVFYNKMNDLIVRTLGIDSLGRFYNYNSNAGKVETKGIEITIQIKPAENFDLEAGCSYQKSIDLNNKDISYSYSPNLLGNLKLNYRLTQKVNATLAAIYVDKMESGWLENPDGSGSRIGNAVPAYYSIDANIRVTDLFKHGIFMELHGTNLFNKDIMYPATTNNNTIFPKGSVGMGRQITFSLGYKF